MYLGIEIGGTKLQLGVSPGDGSPLVELRRVDVVPSRGADGILECIESVAPDLAKRHGVRALGVGFGGPVNPETGVITTSHQISGWEGVPLGQWCRQLLGCPAWIGNDCNVAALAEALFGAGQGRRRVFFVTVGTGVGGGFVVDGRLDGDWRPAIAEIGHLRPGLHAAQPEANVESLASGWGVAANARARLSDDYVRPISHWQDSGGKDPNQLQQRMQDAREADRMHRDDLRQRCEGELTELTSHMVAQAAADGNIVAQDVLQHACNVLGWAIAQTITLVAPEVVVVGGGVSLAGESLFFQPLREAVAQYVFPPLADSYEIVPASLGESVVVHGALALAAQG